MSEICNGLQVHGRIVSYVYERIAAKPMDKSSQWIISRELFPHGMYPSAPFPSQHRCNLMPGEQSDPVAVRILDRHN
jgi:hypothetical protein